MSVNAKNRFKKSEFKNNKPMPWNIYNETTVGEAKKNFHQIHYKFKMLFAYPILAIAKKFMNLEPEVIIPPGKHNDNIKIFDESFEEAAKTWFEEYIPHKIGYKKGSKKGPINRNYPYFTMKKLFIKMLLKDTVHREFFNILAHEFTKRMLDKYSGKKVKHVFYTDKATYNVAYFVITQTAEEMNFNKPINIKMHKLTTK